MRKAALYVQGRIVIGDSHLEAYQKLTMIEQYSTSLVSGFFDASTDEFCADCDKDHFFDKELLLIRHATAFDPSNPDTPISEDGIRQAEKLGDLLLDFDLEGFEAVSSPLLRCLQTASILSQTLGRKFTVQPELAETPVFLDDTDTFCVPNRKDQFPQFKWPSSEDFIYNKEAASEFHTRSERVLHSLPSKTIVVTHYGLICNMTRLALCEDRASVVAGQVIPPASVTYINREELQCLGWNHAEHLSNRPTVAHPKN